MFPQAVLTGPLWHADSDSALNHWRGADLRVYLLAGRIREDTPGGVYDARPLRARQPRRGRRPRGVRRAAGDRGARSRTHLIRLGARTGALLIRLWPAGRQNRRTPG